MSVGCALEYRCIDARPAEQLPGADWHTDEPIFLRWNAWCDIARYLASLPTGCFVIVD